MFVDVVQAEVLVKGISFLIRFFPLIKLIHTVRFSDGPGIVVKPGNKLCKMCHQTVSARCPIGLHAQFVFVKSTVTRSRSSICYHPMSMSSVYTERFDALNF